MSYDPLIHHRRSIRLPGYDYTAPGAYFITIVARGRLPIFGEIENGEMRLNEIGNMIAGFWREIPNVYRHVEIDKFIVMPNHLHGIIIVHENIQPIRTVGATGRDETMVACGVVGATQWDETMVPYGTVGATQWVAPTNPVIHPNPTNGGGRNTIAPGSIGSIIGQFKSVATKRINQFRNMTHASIWQRNYHEHIIRDMNELSRIREYIRNNPMAWGMDDENYNRYHM